MGQPLPLVLRAQISLCDNSADVPSGGSARSLSWLIAYNALAHSALLAWDYRDASFFTSEALVLAGEVSNALGRDSLIQYDFVPTVLYAWSCIALSDVWSADFTLLPCAERLREKLGGQHEGHEQFKELTLQYVRALRP
jgi:hypothetical protein